MYMGWLFVVDVNEGRAVHLVGVVWYALTDADVGGVGVWVQGDLHGQPR